MFEAEVIREGGTVAKVVWSDGIVSGDELAVREVLDDLGELSTEAEASVPGRVWKGKSKILAHPMAFAAWLESVFVSVTIVNGEVPPFDDELPDGAIP